MAEDDLDIFTWLPTWLSPV